MHQDSAPYKQDTSPRGATETSASGKVPAATSEKQPKISLSKGGGAIQSIGEKFQVNPVTGTGSLSIPIAMSPGRSGFTPQLALSYDSGAGNSPFGLGWSVGIPSISRKTQKGLPLYEDEKESDTFLFSGAEDLVPVLSEQADGGWKKEHVEDPDEVETPDYTLYQGARYIVYRYRPRIESLFARIEKWTHPSNGSTFWKSITKENITTIYGESGGISPNEPEWIPWFSENQWLFELVFDYGEHQSEEHDIPTYEALQSWPCRDDIFSSFWSGFDIRTYRLCQRILFQVGKKLQETI